MVFLRLGFEEIEYDPEISIKDILNGFFSLLGYQGVTFEPHSNSLLPLKVTQNHYNVQKYTDMLMKTALLPIYEAKC